MKQCKYCGYWVGHNGFGESVTHPIDETTGKPMAITFEIRKCCSPSISLFERCPDSNGISLLDGENYYAGLFTGQDFGCVNFKSR